jgi:hypothetical protein
VPVMEIYNVFTQLAGISEKDVNMDFGADSDEEYTFRRQSTDENGLHRAFL